MSKFVIVKFQMNNGDEIMANIYKREEESLQDVVSKFDTAMMSSKQIQLTDCKLLKYTNGSVDEHFNEYMSVSTSQISSMSFNLT